MAGLPQGSSVNTTRDFMIEVEKGNVSGHHTVHKFGANAALSNSMAVISDGGIYQTPTAAVSLEFVSGDTGDALDSTGMHELTIQGLDANWTTQTKVVAAHATDGLTAVAIPGTWMRIFRVHVSKSGVYATSAQASHIGVITVRIASAGATYATIPISNSFPVGQSFIGAYTVPADHTAYVLSLTFSSDVSGTKDTSFYFFQRQNSDDVTSSYSGTMRVVNVYAGTQGIHSFIHQNPDAFPEKTDIGFMGITDSGTFNASVEFEMLLVHDGST